MKITKHENHKNRDLMPGPEAGISWKGGRNGEFWGVRGGILAFVQCAQIECVKNVNKSRKKI